MADFDRLFEGPNRIRAAYLGADPVPVWEQPPPLLVPGEEVDRNHALDPLMVGPFRGGTDPWTRLRFLSNRFTGAASGSYSLFADANDGPAGIRTYGRFTVGTTVGASRGFHLAGNPESSSPSGDVIPVNPDEPITVAAWARNSGTNAMRLNLRWVSAPGTWGGGSTTSSTPAFNAGVWVRPTLANFTPPPGSIGFQAYLIGVGNAPAGSTIDATGLYFHRGATELGAVFSGDSVEEGFAFSYDGVAPFADSVKRRLVEYP